MLRLGELGEFAMWLAAGGGFAERLLTQGQAEQRTSGPGSQA